MPHVLRQVHGLEGSLHNDDPFARTLNSLHKSYDTRDVGRLGEERHLQGYALTLQLPPQTDVGLVHPLQRHGKAITGANALIDRPKASLPNLFSNFKEALDSRGIANED